MMQPFVTVCHSGLEFAEVFFQVQVVQNFQLVFHCKRETASGTQRVCEEIHMFINQYKESIISESLCTNVFNCRYCVRSVGVVLPGSRCLWSESVACLCRVALCSCALSSNSNHCFELVEVYARESSCRRRVARAQYGGGGGRAESGWQSYAGGEEE